VSSHLLLGQLPRGKSAGLSSGKCCRENAAEAEPNKGEPIHDQEQIRSGDLRHAEVCGDRNRFVAGGGLSKHGHPLLLPENLGSKEWFTLKTTKAPEGATTGAGSGAVIGGALVGSGIPEYEAKRYEERLQKGGILISVHCDTSQEIERARIVLQRTGAEDVSTTSESSAKGAGS